MFSEQRGVMQAASDDADAMAAGDGDARRRQAPHLHARLAFQVAARVQGEPHTFLFCGTSGLLAPFRALLLTCSE